MPLEDFLDKPVMVNGSIVNGIAVGGTRLTADWWNNTLFAWILKLLQNSNYPSVTPSDLVESLYNGDFIIAPLTIQSLYQKTIGFSIDTTSVYINNSLFKLPFTIETDAVIYLKYDGSYINFGINGNHAVTPFTTSNTYKKINVGIIYIYGILSVHCIEGTEGLTVELAGEPTSYSGQWYYCGQVIVQNNGTIGSSGQILPISASNIISQGLIYSSGSASIEDTSTTQTKTWSSSNIADHILAILDDQSTSETKTWSASRIIDALQNNSNSHVIIDDLSTDANKTWSSSNISSKLNEQHFELTIKNETESFTTETISIDNNSGLELHQEIDGSARIAINRAYLAQYESITTVNSSGYVIINTDRILHIIYDGAVTIVIPQSVLAFGKQLVCKDARGLAGTIGKAITITCEGTHRIDGQQTSYITTAYGSLQMYTDGLNYYTISGSGGISTPPESQTSGLTDGSSIADGSEVAQ